MALSALLASGALAKRGGTGTLVGWGGGRFQRAQAPAPRKHVVSPDNPLLEQVIR